jgi:hypothetical protein
VFAFSAFIIASKMMVGYAGPISQGAALKQPRVLPKLITFEGR